MALKRELKTLASLLGAFIIFWTFVAKDMRRDKLKDLADSIDSAENAYIIRMDHRKMEEKLRAFTMDFAEFRQHPTVAIDPGDARGGGDDSWPHVLKVNNVATINDVAVSEIPINERAEEELLDNVIRLSNELSIKGATQKKIADTKGMVTQFWATWEG